MTTTAQRLSELESIPGQPTIIVDLRTLIDDLQGSTTSREWARRSAALTAYLEIVEDRWQTTMVGHNLGHRRYGFLVRYAEQRGLRGGHA